MRRSPRTVLTPSRQTRACMVHAVRWSVWTSRCRTSMTTLLSSNVTSTLLTSLSACVSALWSARCRRLTMTSDSMHSLLTRLPTPTIAISRSVHSQLCVYIFINCTCVNFLAVNDTKHLKFRVKKFESHSVFSVEEYIVLASCLIYAKPLRHPFRAFIEYICGCVLFQDFTIHEISGR